MDIVVAMGLRRLLRGRRPMPATLNILHVVTGHSLAGVEHHVLLLAEQQRARGNGVHVVFPRGGWIQTELEQRGIPHKALGLRGTLDPVSVSKIYALHRRERFDIVHGHLIRGLFYALTLGKMAGIPSIGTDHMNSPNWTMAHLNALIVGAGSLTVASPGCIVRPHEIIVVPYGVDGERLAADAVNAAAERASWDIPEDAPAIGLLGRVTCAKGHDFMLQALAMMQTEPKPWLLCVGPEEPEWGTYIREMAADLGVADRVKFLGPRSNVGAFLAACDVIAGPSRMEACPLALLEAMTLGRPVAAANVGGVKDVLKDDVNGVLLPPEDAPALAAALDHLLGDAGLRERLGETAREMAQTRFTLAAMELATRRVYLNALRPAAVGAMA